MIKKSEKIFFNKINPGETKFKHGAVAVADIALIYNHFKSPYIYFYDKNDKECGLLYSMSGGKQIIIYDQNYNNHYAIIEDADTWPFYSARISFEIKMQARNPEDFQDQVANFDPEYYVPDSLKLDTEPKIVE